MAAGLWGALAGAGLGIGKHYLSDKPAFQSQAELASTQTRYSPWSKMGMGTMPEKRPSLFNSAMEGAVSGGMQGAAMGTPALGGSAANSAASPWTSLGVKGIGPVASGDAYQDALSKYHGYGDKKPF